MNKCEILRVSTPVLTSKWPTLFYRKTLSSRHSDSNIKWIDGER